MKIRKYLLSAGIILTVMVMIFSACPTDSDNSNGTETGGDPGKLLILQVYGTGDAVDGAVSHNFIELYNPESKSIKLDGFSVQYANGKNASEDDVWKKIDLNGTIGPKSSFLILGAKKNPGGRLMLDDSSGDIKTDFVLSNRSFKVALMQSTEILNVKNPFDTDDQGTVKPGLIDLVGAVNSSSDQIFGYKTAPGRISKQSSVRRISLYDTSDNSADFANLRFQGISDEALALYKPHNSKIDGTWNPLPDLPALFILQVYGTGEATDGSVSHNFIELYNNFDTDIDLNGYSLHYADGISSGKDSVGPWTKINLTGTIPANCSYLILGKKWNTAARLEITETPDMNIDFTLSNRSFKIALMSNQGNLAVANPFDTDGNGAKAPGFVDLLGVINTLGVDDIDASKGNLSIAISKQKAVRRMNMVDSSDNETDFIDVDYRANQVTDYQLPWLSPKTVNYGPHPLVF